ncbi:MAG: FxLYD domain-containing protein [Methanobacterium sp.]
MIKKAFIILMISIIIGISGCTINDTANQTFGEKIISLDAITIQNTISGNYTYDGNDFYYIDGYVQNNNKNDVFFVKLNVSVFDKGGNLISSNETSPELKDIPANKQSHFYIEFNDPDKKISRFEIKIIDAKSGF